ncbi:MauE/DoxX family redox-associated membrane protein [Flavobacterium aestivum]|uniref:MauE/DoxX family redox-associated membrane protein n=1 Tax=Flavobacterium aestivum TaxID=3003257 RepID=UPI002285B14F|nr:MauE/DoxX family redox-associated membrane protein [Flavobacterium aestivum]
MKFSLRHKSIFIEAVCMLYILLFVYAATSKLFDFENFQVQLGQSPLLSAFTDWISILVPAIEYLICVLILVPKLRLVGLFAAYGLMGMFTVYIFIILHYTSFVPCSCGGVLEKLNWNQHLIFNIFFVILAVLAIFFHFSNNRITGNKLRLRTIFALFFGITICVIVLVIALFLMSENIIHYHNKLTRRFPHTPIHTFANTDLKLNSYYIAGGNKEHIYLGNTTAPLLITVLNDKLVQIEKKLIDLNQKDLPFKGMKVIVQAPYFFAIDGTVPCVYRGSVKDWKAKLIKKGGEYFTTAEAIDSTAIAVCTYSSKNGEGVLGVIHFNDNAKTILNPEILQKQFDGVFDTDGQLLYSNGLKRIIYLYAYRNQFTVADTSLKIDFRGNTIDTISHAKLSIVKVKSHHQRKFSKPPLFVNKNSTAYNNLLFVNSAIPGRYEEDQMWKEASIIDVYDLSKNSYLFSFCIYNIDGKKLKSFFVQNDKLYALIGNHIIEYNLDKRITSNYK